MSDLKERVLAAQAGVSETYWEKLVFECLTQAAMSVLPDHTRASAMLAEVLWVGRYGEADPFATSFPGSETERWMTVLIQQASHGCAQAASRALTLFARAA